MNTFMKRISVYLVAAIVSVGATYGTYKYLEQAKPYSAADTYNYGKEFDQKNVQLASYTSEGYPDFTQAAENTIHAVVHIKSIAKQEAREARRQPMNPFEFFFGPGQGGGGDYQPQPRIGSGSGVIISADGYIMTNNHVIDGATELEVTLNDNSKHNAKVIGADPDTDIALIKIEGNDLPYVPFGDSDKLKVGEWVLAVGNPFNLTSTVTKGIVSAKARGNIGGGGGNSIQSFIQTDAAINPGNSGGALVNTSGQLIGINTAIYSQTGSFAGYGFAVPISIAGKVVADIKEYGTVQRAMLGVQILDLSIAKDHPDKEIKETAQKIKLNDGVYVGGFAERSPAKQAGVEKGDVITAVNGVKTPSTSVLQEQVSRFRPGDKIKMEIDRQGSTMAFDVMLKNSDGNTEIIKKEDGLATVGAAFIELSTEKKKELGISYGVEVGDVDRNGAFAKQGITKGFVIQEINNQPVNGITGVEKVIDSIAASKDKVLFIKGISPTGKRDYKMVKLTE